MAVVEYGGWSMPVSQKVAEDPKARAEIIKVLKEIVRVSDIEKAYELTSTAV